MSKCREVLMDNLGFFETTMRLVVDHMEQMMSVSPQPIVRPADDIAFLRSVVQERLLANDGQRDTRRRVEALVDRVCDLSVRSMLVPQTHRHVPALQEGSVLLDGDESVRALQLMAMEPQ